MTELRRWLDAGDASPDVLDLLKEARPPRPLDASTRMRSQARLSALAAVPPAAGVMFWIKGAALGAILGGAVAAVVYFPRLRSESTVKGPEISAPQSALPSASVANPDPEKTDAGALTEVPLPSSVASATVPAPTHSAYVGPAGNCAAPANLARETQLLERARQLLGSNPGQALGELAQHQREFPNGALRLEREFLAVDALLRLGRRAEARKRADRLRASAPGSIYDRRISQLFGD
jgi:hypothetical protein